MSIAVVVPAVVVPVPLAPAALDTTTVEVELPVDLVLVLREHVDAYHVAGLEVAAAVEAGRVVGAAAAVVDRGLWIRTQRAAARDHTPGGRGREDLRRCSAVLDPAHQRAEQILGLGSGTAGAMRDSGGTEQPVELLQPIEVRLVVPAVVRSH